MLGVNSDDDGPRPPPPTTTTPKRKRPVSSVRGNPRSINKTGVQGAQGIVQLDPGPLSPEPSPSHSPSPPPSPSLRSTKRIRTGVASSIATSPQEKSDPSSGKNVSQEKRPSQQATLTSFFTPKPSQGTGILKGRTTNTIGKNNTNSNVDEDSDSDGDSDDNSDKNGIKTCIPTPASSSSSTKSAGLVSKRASSVQEPPKKLEQLFLSFRKDRTKMSSPSKPVSTPSSSSSSSTGTSTLSTRRPTTTRLSREDEKSKRYHCPQCGMPYVRGQPEDEQIHDRYHRATVGGIDYPGYKNEVVVAVYNDPETAGLAHSGISGGTGGSTGNSGNSRIVMVPMSDTGKSTTSSSASSASSFEKKKVSCTIQRADMTEGRKKRKAQASDASQEMILTSMYLSIALSRSKRCFNLSTRNLDLWILTLSNWILARCSCMSQEGKKSLAVLLQNVSSRGFVSFPPQRAPLPRIPEMTKVTAHQWIQFCVRQRHQPPALGATLLRQL